MPILGQLRRLYADFGHEAVYGVPAKLSGLPLSEFTYIVTRDNQTTGNLGISPYEIYFLEHLFQSYRPKRIFIVGNSFGWSTFALALLNPDAKVVAIEAGFEPFTDAWINETNRMASERGAQVQVCKGVSPNDVKRVAAECFGEGEKVDFFFIDGLHTVEQVQLDYAACAEIAAPDAVYLFHDALYWNLTPGIERIVERARLDRHDLWRTSTGMTLLCDNKASPEAAEVARAFDLGPKTPALYDFWRKQG